jgi:hypothetical protein
LKSEEKSELHFPNFSLNFSPEFARPRPCFLRPILDCEITSEVMKNRKKPEFARVTGGDPVGIISWNEGSGGAKMGAGTDHRGGDGRKKRP